MLEDGVHNRMGLEPLAPAHAHSGLVDHRWPCALHLELRKCYLPVRKEGGKRDIGEDTLAAPIQG